MSRKDYVSVLDYGFVRLVDSMGSDVSIVRAARTSHNAAWRAGKDKGSDERLIRYLWENHHTTPFEAVTFTFEVKAPIFVVRQWHRHRTWSYNELSGRYRELPSEFYTPKAEHIGTQSPTNRQCRVLPSVASCNNSETERYRDVCLSLFQEYKRLLENGWPRELARMVLPLSTYTHMFATVSLLNLMRFLTLRCAEDAQWEIRQYAEALRVLAKEVCPVALQAWEDGLRCPRSETLSSATTTASS